MEPDNEMLRDRAQARGWEPMGDDTWVASSPDGSERAVVRALPDGFDARVFRYHTAPSPGPDPEPSHGPQLFEACEDALDYAESNLGGDWHSAAE